MKWYIDNLAFVQAIKSIFDNDSSKIVSKEGQRIIDEDGEELKELLKPKPFYCSYLVKELTFGNCKTQCKKCNFISKNLEQ